jgi:hypothetical protein
MIFHAFCPRHSCFKIVGGLGLVARRWCKDIHASEFGRIGGQWNMLRRARVVGFAWSLSVPSLLATVYLSGFFRRLFMCCLWLNFASVSYATLCFVLHIFRMRFPSGIFMLFGAVVRFPYEISCLWRKICPQKACALIRKSHTNSKKKHALLWTKKKHEIS